MNDFNRFLNSMHDPFEGDPFHQLSEILKEIGKAIGRSPNDPLTLKLAWRRIHPDVVVRFKISACRDGWTYLTPQGAKRFKNANSDAPNKYAWIGDKRDTLLYGPDLHEAIRKASGHVWLVTEFDLLSMQSAGIFHVIAQLQGEGSVPNDLSALLQSFGVTVCHIAPDRDGQGTAWAQRVADTLIPAGIEVWLWELPYPCTPKHGGDIGKLWQEYSQEQPFEQYLVSLPAARLRQRNDVKRKNVKWPYSIPQNSKTSIAQALGVASYNDRGYSKNIPCPFHDDARPSAALHREYGLHCFAEGKWHKWRDLAFVLGLPWKGAR